ncbi:MAG: PQQ-binding-like beta-propeller repeat protein, partial [Anaerolineae bacterium]
MKARRLRALILLIVFLSVTVLTACNPLPAQAGNAYIDPALLTLSGADAEIIVTARSIDIARNAVKRVGGRVDAELDLIDGVAATLPASRIRRLAGQPGVLALVGDKPVETSGLGQEGWISEIRIPQETHHLKEAQVVPAAYFPDGSLVSLDEGGGVLILNSDGSLRTRTALPDDVYRTPIVMGEEPALAFVSGQTTGIYALSPAGEVLWHFDGELGRIESGLHLDQDGILYAVDQALNACALVSATGDLRWCASLKGDGTVRAPGQTDVQGNVYFATEKGHLIAVGADGVQRWSIALETDALLAQPPLISGDGTVYVVGARGIVYGVNPDGSLKFQSKVEGKISQAPVLGPDGSLYVTAERLGLAAIAPDGTLRFVFSPASGTVKTSPLLSQSGSAVYVVTGEGDLVAIDTATGAELWRNGIAGRVKASPVLDNQDNVVVVTVGGQLLIFGADGTQLFENRFAGHVTQVPAVSPQGDLAVRINDRALTTLARLPDAWDGQADALPTDDGTVWDLVNPVSVDVGADQLHERDITG